MAPRPNFFEAAEMGEDDLWRGAVIQEENEMGSLFLYSTTDSISSSAPSLLFQDMFYLQRSIQIQESEFKSQSEKEFPQTSDNLQETQVIEYYCMHTVFFWLSRGNSYRCGCDTAFPSGSLSHTPHDVRYIYWLGKRER